MPFTITYVRRKELSGTFVPVVPGVLKHDELGWPISGIYEGEWYFRTGSEQEIYSRIGNNIIKIYPIESPSSSLSIGDPITGSRPNNILFVSGGNLSGSDNFRWNSNTNTLQTTNISSSEVSATFGYFTNITVINPFTVSYALNALTSSYILSSSYSLTSSYSVRSLTSSYSSTSLTSSYSLTSLSSSYSNNSLSSSYSLTSLTSSYSNTSLTSSYTLSSSYSNNSDFSITSSHAVGYMSKSIYDTDNDNVVDKAARIELMVANRTGVTLTKGQVVYISGSFANRNMAWLAVASSSEASDYAVGLMVEDVISNASGGVCTLGNIHEFDTTAIPTGNPVWLHPTTPGAMTVTKPTSPSHSVFLGFIGRSHATLGRMYVKVQNGYQLEELYNVITSSVTDGDILIRSSSVWINSKSYTGSLQGTSSWSNNSITSSYILNAISSSYSSNSLTSSYSSFALSSSYKVPLAKVDITLMSASIAATTIYTPNQDGMYTVTFNGKVKSVGTTSTIGPFQFRYTDAEDSVVVTGPSNNTNGINQSNNNTTNGAVIGGTYVVYAKSGSAIQYLMSYSSTGTAMSYSLHIRID